MALNLSVPNFGYSTPWFMFDLANKQLITSVIIPESDIADTKEVVLTEQPIPGQDFSPVNSGGMGNRKLSFTLPVVKRNNTAGNILILRQFENLRERAFGFNFRPQDQFTPNPKVLYGYGVNAVPLIYFVKKCDFRHRQGMTNNLGNPTFTYVDFELWLDEANRYNRQQALVRKVGSLVGMVEQTFDLIQSLAKGSRPY